MTRPSGPALGLVLGLLGSALACGPNPRPARVKALIPDAQGKLTSRVVELATVTDLPTLEGTVTHFVGGASVVIDSSDQSQTAAIASCQGAQSDAQTKAYCFDAFAKNPGRLVQVSFIDQDGVLSPADFHSWNLVSAFYNFERAYQYFQSVYQGVEPTELEGLKILYWGDVRIESPDPIVDNALFLSMIQSFDLAPFATADQVPLAMNAAIIGHEMAHRVFNHKALGDYGYHPALRDWSLTPFNLLKSIDEGFADFHGYGVSCNEPSLCQPAFLTSSFKADLAHHRDFSRPDICITSTMQSDLANLSKDSWLATDLYPYGTLWAAALFQGASKAKASGAMTELQAALIASYPDIGNQLTSLWGTGASGQFTPELVADIILSHVSDVDLRTKVCSELLTRLALQCTTSSSHHCDEIPSCPAASAADTAVCKEAP